MSLSSQTDTHSTQLAAQDPPRLSRSPFASAASLPLQKGVNSVTNIEDIKQELQGIKAQYKSKLEQLHRAQAEVFFVKLGDLLEVQDGTYGKPNVKVYLVSKLVFNLTQQPSIYGNKRLKDGKSFSHAQVLLFFRGDETPAVIGHLDDWQRFLASK